MRGRTEAHREAYQSKLVVKLLQHDLSLLQKAELIRVWGTFCINTTTRQYRLPRNLTIMALVGTLTDQAGLNVAAVSLA
jgi:hypothetical protein